MGWFVELLNKLLGGRDNSATSTTGPTSININVETGHNNQNAPMGAGRSNWHGNGGKVKSTPRKPSSKPTQPAGTPSKSQHEIERIAPIALYGLGTSGEIPLHSLSKRRITGIKIKTKLKNTTKLKKEFKLRFCVYSQNGRLVAKAEKEFIFEPGECRDRYLVISGEPFAELCPGTYGYEFWIDNAKLLDRSKCTFKLK